MKQYINLILNQLKFFLDVFIGLFHNDPLEWTFSLNKSLRIGKKMPKNLSPYSSPSHCRFRAVFWMILWAALFSTAMSLAKLLSPSVNPVTLIFSRSFMGLLAGLPLFMRNGFMVHLRTPQLNLHLLRILIVSCAMGCTYYAYRELPLAYAAAIGQTGPLFTTILAIVLLKEQVKLSKWIALGVGYIGVLVIIRPTHGVLDSTTLIALLANLLAGIGIITSKKLTTTDSSETILFYATFGVLTVSGILSFWFWTSPSGEDLFKLAGMGISGVLSQYCYLRSLHHAPASFVTPFEYSRLCMMVPIGFFIFQEIPDIWTLIGSLIIIMAIIFLTKTDTTTKEEK